jgi:hypothetical protein
MAKPRIERSLLFPNKEFRERVRKASKDRGFRSEQAFIFAACEREIRRGDDAESVTQFEALIAATLTNLAKQGQHLHTLADEITNRQCDYDRESENTAKLQCGETFF